MFLTPEELVTLTGYVLPKCQIKWLQLKGYIFEINKKGDPVVTKLAVERKQGLIKKEATIFNFEAMK